MFGLDKFYRNKPQQAVEAIEEEAAVGVVPQSPLERKLSDHLRQTLGVPEEDPYAFLSGMKPEDVEILLADFPEWERGVVMKKLKEGSIEAPQEKVKFTKRVIHEGFPHYRVMYDSPLGSLMLSGRNYEESSLNIELKNGNRFQIPLPRIEGEYDEETRNFLENLAEYMVDVVPWDKDYLFSEDTEKLKGIAESMFREFLEHHKTS